MFNGLIIRELLKAQNRTEKEFSDYFWPNGKPDFSYLEKKESINTSRLEKLAAFFKCSTDVFFTPKADTENQNIIVNNNTVGNININNRQDLEKEIKFLNMTIEDKERLIKEKDERISTLNSYINLLKKEINSGQKSDTEK